MLPIVLNLVTCRVMLIGDDAAAVRRLCLIEAAGAENVRVFAPMPVAELVTAAGSRLVRRLPDRAEIAAARLVFMSDRHASYIAAIAAMARAAGVLLHIEDDPARSDFALPAILRRGDLCVAVSTGGASPALAVALRDRIAGIIGSDWDARTAEIARLRRAWRADGADAEKLKQRTADWLGRQGWPAHFHS
ncbi:MAG: precorrin-2 dehydrogenase/sirohydrochlorin ferrochelatase family protein [Stellaceae bacterium]